MDIAPEQTRSPSYSSSYKSILTTPVCATQDFVMGGRRNQRENRNNKPCMGGFFPFQSPLLAATILGPLILYLQILYV
jgi:hypothetical protein